MDRPAYATVPPSVQVQSVGSNMHNQNQPSSLANNSAGMNHESNLEFASNVATPLPSLSNDHIPFQSQPAPGVGQLSLNRSVAEYRRNQLSADLLHVSRTQGTGNGFLMHNQAFPAPDYVNEIRFGRSQLLNSIPTRDLSSFLNEQISIQNQLISDLTNVHWTLFGGNPGTHPYVSSHDLCYQTSSPNQPADPINFVVAEYISNGDVARSPISLSVPRVNNPISFWNQPSIGTEQNLAEFSFQLSNPLLHHQPAQGMNNMHYGPNQSNAIRARRHINRRNSGPYACPRCRNEFAFSQSLAAHLREHTMLDDQTNWITGSTSRMMNSDAHAFLLPTRSPFPPMSLNNTNRGDRNINFSDGMSNRRLNPLISFRRESDSMAAPERSLGRSNDHPTVVAHVHSSSALDLAANDGCGKEPALSEQASLEKNAPNQGQPASDVATKDNIPRSVKEESSD
ncbi:uncharacterized protein LOC112490755 isoform X1 [Ziziphus jujuba]|uniref:Uncharacterized protein LOC112490755 isoform X1 n=1 Tax=Ziziphus jujuba TaxID=326968 RepID=A0ABM3IAS0_ZIZJJ|nr:uncharacterized protein LOC112490755 isoform X1 [Ziziphus jujuba]XP_048324536.1 uncharacterized protein LOC112490755 isoform X1 [Ziziphus jujuba]XP_048324538.1 uncharacterized protein LOC112490755 isoform X1 [Ziziphus jujuba]XP_060668191.1 uncharacterized protein LOC112490755 isoform X1 [Ziziphus jujuba]